MVSIEEVHTANNAHYRGHPCVAVFVGGTSGIGEHTARALAATQPSHLRLYLVGRNNEAAERILSECSRMCEVGEFKFVKVDDLTLITEVDRVSSVILGLEREHQSDPRVDLLVMTQAQLPFGGRHETEEGIDQSMSLLYYSRIRFINNLLPLLGTAPSAHVISVYGAGLESKVIKHDLSLRDPKHYGIISVRSHIALMTTMAFEHLAQQNATLSLVHIFPGIVITPAYIHPAVPWWFKLFWAVLGPIIRRFLAIDLKESGARVLFLGTPRFAAREAPQSQLVINGTNGNPGSGAYAVNEYNEVVSGKLDLEELRDEHFIEYVWQHTLHVFSNI